MATVNEYSVLIYGSPEGYQTNRAQIQLKGGASNAVVAWVRFNDPGMAFEADSVDSGGRILMHLPSHMFGPTLEMLRNEKPINVYFAAGRGFLGTSAEPAGEGES